MSIFKYKPTGRIGLFDREYQKEKLSKLGNPLEKLHKVIDFEIFRPELELDMLNHEKESHVGNKPYVATAYPTLARSGYFRTI